MTELLPTGSTAMTAIADPPLELQLVARSPDQMQVAQQQLVDWFRAKVNSLRQEAADANDNLRIAEQNGFKIDPFKRQAAAAWRRVTFYEKCLAAAEAGYVVVPNFPVDVFAVRTTKQLPKAEEKSWSSSFPQPSDNSPVGQGRYVDREPYIASRKEKFHNDKGELLRTETYWRPTQFDESIEYPVSIAQPAVMTATAEAMARKVFDEIGCLPGRRAQGDPIVVGRICGRLGRSLPTVMSFLIAWYIDTREL